MTTAYPAHVVKCKSCGAGLVTRSPRPDILCIECRRKDHNMHAMVVYRRKRDEASAATMPIPNYTDTDATCSIRCENWLFCVDAVNHGKHLAEMCEPYPEKGEYRLTHPQVPHFRSEWSREQRQEYWRNRSKRVEVMV